MASPGWYPDPQDPSWHQYYDGHRWTGERRPANASFPQTAPLPSYPPQPSPQPQPWEQAEQPQRWGQAEQPQPGAQSQPWGQAPHPQAWEQQRQQPSWEQPQTWEQPSWAQPPRRRRTRVPLIVGLVAVLAAGLGVGGYLLFRGSSSPTLTFDGKAIDLPDKPLQQTAAVVRSLVSSRHGAQSKDTRCYYALRTQPTQDAKKSDVDDSIWCGPVLFVDGDPSKQYLRFPLNSQPAADGKVTLTPSGQPASDDPEAVPSGLELKRPDKARPPSGAGGLSVPAPPPAAKNALLAADLGSATVPAAPHGAVIGSINGGVTITKLGTVKRYGSGDAARSAPSGYKLIAFRLTGALGDDGVPADLSSDAAVSINSGAAHKLPNAASDQYLVVAVPKSARSVDLVLNDGGYKQTLSLLSGKPGAHNIKVLARSHRHSDVRKSGTVRFAYSQTVGFPDGSSGTSQTGTFTVDGAMLAFRLPSKHVKASSTSKALLYVEIGFTVPESPGRNFGFPPATMTFRPTGGGSIKARNVATAADRIYNIFEVPADLTSGTLRVAGSSTTTFVNSSSTYTTTIATPISLLVTFPAG